MLKKALSLLFIATLLAGCKNDLDVLAPYKESVAVYGLLDQDDTAQYIRVQRVFLGEGNALVMAQNPDSVYFKPGELKVSLQRIRNGVLLSEIVLSEAYVTTDTGVFNNNQLIYKTNSQIYSDSQYKLIVRINRSGAEFTAGPIGLVGDFSNRLVYGQEGSVLTPSYAFINIVPAFGGGVVCKYGSPLNTGVCGLKLRFYYTEYGNTGGTVAMYKDMDLGFQYTYASGGGEEIDLSYTGDAMLANLVSTIGINSSIQHRTADSIRFILNAAGPDLGLYNQVNSTTTLSQEKPYYTNIVGGVGVFSSRRDYVVRKRLSAQAMDRIASDNVSCQLRFYGSAGTFLPCN